MEPAMTAAAPNKIEREMGSPEFNTVTRKNSKKMVSFASKITQTLSSVGSLWKRKTASLTIKIQSRNSTVMQLIWSPDGWGSGVRTLLREVHQMAAPALMRWEF